MRRWLSLLCLAAVTGGCSTGPLRIDSRAMGDQTAASPDRLIIAAVDNASAAFLAHAGSTPRGYDSITVYGPSAHARNLMHDLAREYGLREISAWPIEPLHMHCAVLEIPAGADRDALLARLAKDTRVQLAQPLQVFATRTENYNDPYVDLQRGFRLMNVAEAHAWSLGDGVSVAIIDTGADTQHPDLRGSIVAAANFVDGDADQFRRDRHGTEMAGVIAAVANNRQGIVGVAPGARLMVLKACWQARPDADAASCNSFTLARALAAAFDAHAQVVNLSVAGPRDPLLTDLIREGVRRGVLFVGAAAPSQRRDDGSPLKDQESLLHQAGVIEVVSAENRAAAGGSLHAPGREILTLLPGGHYDFASGDSIATAQVTGVVALLLAKNPALTADAVYTLLHDTSLHSEVLAGSERVDACSAVVALLGRGSCKTPRDEDFGQGAAPDGRVALH
jgi:hypothetical protein